MFPGQFKIAGHSDVKHRKGFAGVKKNQEQIIRTKGYVSKGNNRREIVRQKIKRSIFPKIIMLVLRITFVLGLFFALVYIGRTSLLIEEAHIQETEQYLRTYESKLNQEAFVFFVKSANYYYQGGNWELALDEYERASKLAPDDGFVKARLEEVRCQIEP